MQHSVFTETHNSYFLEEQEENIQVVIANLKKLQVNYSTENLNRATRSYQALIHADLSRLSANQEVDPELYSPTRLVLIKQEEEEGTLTVAVTQEEETASNVDLAHKQAHKQPTPEVHLTTVETSSGGPVLRPTKPRLVKSRLKVKHSQVLRAEQKVFHRGDIVQILNTCNNEQVPGRKAEVIRVTSRQVHLRLGKSQVVRRSFKNVRKTDW
jgi:hypothetical protein